MKSFIITALTGALLLSAGPAGAVDAAEIEARYTPGLELCLDTPDGQSTAGTIGCIAAELKIQDAALNAAYRRLTAGMNARQQAGLRSAQRAWIAYRDADCASRQDWEWGSMSTVAANFCVLRRTVERTIELETFAPE